MTKIDMDLFRNKYQVCCISVTCDAPEYPINYYGVTDYEKEYATVHIDLFRDGFEKLVQDVLRNPIENMSSCEKIDPDAIYFIKFDPDSVTPKEASDMARLLDKNNIRALIVPKNVDLIGCSIKELEFFRKQIDEMIACSSYDELVRRAKSEQEDK